MKLERKRNRNFFRSKLVLASLVFVFFIIAFYTTGSLYQNYQIRREMAILDKTIEDLNHKNNELKFSEKKLTDPDFIEREAKVKLNLKKEGEEVVVLVDDPYSLNNGDGDKKSGAKESESVANTNVKKWIDLIFGNKL